MSASKNDLQVIHLATGSVGGAGLAARRLNKALNVSGFKSKFYSPIRKNYTPAHNEFELSRSSVAKFKSAISTRLQRNLHRVSFFSLFSVNSVSMREIKNLGEKDKSILQFHNWFNLLSQKSILKLAKSGYKVVLTMHDERFFTGGCHYALECRRFSSGCNSCPRLPALLQIIPARNVRLSKSLMRKAHANITFVAPSKWILDEAQKSQILGNSNLVHISNTLSEELSGIPLVRHRLNPKTLSIGIASMDHTSFVKGGDTLQLITSEIKNSGLPINFIYFNQLPSGANPEQKFWEKIDYLLSLSRADNSPNVIHEAKFRGIPVISTAIGGITELLTSPPDVEIPASARPEQIVSMLTSLIGKAELVSLESSNKAFLAYVGDSVNQHIALYKSILGM
jgi:glycosyltransferase involved in cell wall biosynthesis